MTSPRDGAPGGAGVRPGDKAHENTPETTRDGDGDGQQLMVAPRPCPLPRFYPIIDHPRWLDVFIPAGVKLVQLRMKNTPLSDVRRHVAEAVRRCDDAGVILVVNDYWDIAVDCGAPWVHLGQEDLNDADRGAIADAGVKLGVSTHDDSELQRALSLAPDYVALGPVYPTTTKKMRWHRQGLGKVTEWRSLVGNTPLVAIGGLTVERAPGVLRAGADIVSVISDVTGNPDPASRIAQWLRVTSQIDAADSFPPAAH